jgi:Tfp pilus assembly protein PilF
LVPDDPGTLIALGAAWNGAGDWQKARDVFAHVITSAHASEAQKCDGRFNVATLDLRNQRLNDAESEFRFQLTNCPEDSGAHIGLAETLMTEGLSDRAEPEFRRGLELDPENFEALMGMSEIELEAGDNASAIQHLDNAIRIRPSFEQAHNELARAYAQSGDSASALSELREAAKLKPDDSLVHSALSQVLAGVNNLQDAIAEQKLALKLLDDDPDGWNNLGVLEARTGKTEAARKDFERALALEPGHAEARANLAHLPAPH